MNSHLGNSILSAVRSVLPESMAVAQLHEPCFSAAERETLNECMDSGFVSSVGEMVGRFEGMLAEFTGAPYVIACVSGTAALHISCVLAEVGRDDEVLMPALTFVATPNAVAYCSAIPHFVDVEERTLGIDPERLESYLDETALLRGGQCFNRKTGRRIRALVVVHTFGHPASMERLLEVCEKFRITVIEDAAESLGSKWHGKSLGTFAPFGATSFNGNKIITTGGGGAIFCHEKQSAERARHLTTTGKLPHAYRFTHDRLAYNYRMPNLNAALGCAQAQKLSRFVSEKRKLAELYQAAFEKVSGTRFFVEPAGAESNYWLNAVLLESPNLEVRDQVIEHLRANGIMVRPVWDLMSSLPMYASCPSMDLSVSRAIEARLFNLPSSSFLAYGNA